MPDENYVRVPLTMVSAGGILLHAFRKPSVVDPDPVEIYDILDGGSPSSYLPEPEPDTPMSGPPSYSVILDETPLLPDSVWVPVDMAPPPGYELVTVTLSLRGQKTGGNRGRWGVCYTCQEEYPLSEMTKIGGRWYCHRNRCAEEQQS